MKAIDRPHSHVTMWMIRIGSELKHIADPDNLTSDKLVDADQ